MLCGFKSYLLRQFYGVILKWLRERPAKSLGPNWPYRFDSYSLRQICVGAPS